MPYTLKTQEIKYKDPLTGQYVGVNAIAERSTAEYQSAIRSAGQTAVNSITTTKNSAITAINNKAQELTSQLTTSEEMEAMIAVSFSSSDTYEEGQYVIVTDDGVNKLYRFTAVHTGAWTGDDAVEVTVGDEVKDLSDAFNATLTPVFFTPDMYPPTFPGNHGSRFKPTDGAIESVDTDKYIRTDALELGYKYKSAIILDNPDYEFSISYFNENGIVSTTATNNGYLGCSEYRSGIQYIPEKAIKFGLSFRRVDDVALTDTDIAAIQLALSAYAPTDTTLYQTGMVADAKAVGDLIRSTTVHLDDVESSVNDMATLVNNLGQSISSYVANAQVEGGVAYFYNSDGETLFTLTGIGGGGGSGGGGGDSGATSTVTLTNTTGWASATVSSTMDVVLSLSWSSVEDGDPTGDGVLNVTVNNMLKETRNLLQGNFTVDVTDYLTVGPNKISIKVTDEYGAFKTKIFNINVEQLSITSTFDASTVQNGPLTFTYTPFGAFSKTIHFELDGTDIDTVTTSASGRQMNQVIPQQTHGAHTLRVWYTTLINGTDVPSNVLVYDIIWSIAGNTNPIVSSSYSETTVGQYSTITIPFMVYNPVSQVCDVTIKLDNVAIQTLTDVGREMQSMQVRLDNTGSHTISIQTGTAHKDITLTVSGAEMEMAAETENLLLHLTSYGRSNLEAQPATWEYTDANSTTISATLTNFNWVSNGWVRDDDDITALRLNSGAQVSIPFTPFANDFRTGGYTIEVEFAVRDVQDYTHAILSCMNGGRGLQFTAQNAEMHSEQSSIGVQFKDGDHIRISFVVGKTSANRLLMCYINGIPSRVVQYPALDDFTQVTPANITMNGNYCTLDIYNIRIYNNDLTGEQILGNWVADTQDGQLMLERYNRNNVYDAYGAIAISKLPSSLPYMIIACPELPQYKGDKKQCTGRYVDPLHPEKSFEFTGCEINVQGTSSAVYARKNYDMKFKNGFDMSDGTNAKNYQMVSTVKPFNRFVMKADVASSEGANNVELVKLYCDMTPYKTREMLADSQVRQGIYGFPIVIFWTNTDTGETLFLGKYNFNFPKRAPAPYGYSDDMESWEFQNNTSNLMLFKSDYFDETLKEDPTTGDIKATWLYDYEARFPDDTWTDYSKLQELQSFIYSTYRAEATGDALDNSVTYDGVTYTNDTAEYRLAKFKNEIGNYAEINSLVFYYIFTLFFLLADSRAKNLFIGFSGSDTDPNKVTTIDRKMVCEPYDMDTALGINNEGSLTFTYSLEDTDVLANGRDVYTGQSSVLWNNVRDAFPSEIRSMYQSLRSGGLFNYNTIESRFENHQAAWPEAVWIEDSRFKYIFPLTRPDAGKEPTDAYLEMMLGSKLEQRRWWLSNRFKYMDSKFSAGDALSEVIQFRAYATSSLTITPYSDLYVTVKYGSYTGQQKTPQGTPVTITVPIDNLSDTETYIYSASQIADVGDLSPFMMGWADFSHATQIQRIKIGDSDSNYQNLPFERLTLGNNRLLKVLDCRNCVNLGTGEMKTVNMSGCVSIEEAYFDNTQITGVELPNGSPIKKLHLPGTVTNLTLRNQTNLTEFICGTDAQNPDYSHISTLWLENPASCVDTLAIVNELPAGCRVRLYNFTWNMQDLDDVVDMFDILDTMRGLDQNGNNTDSPQVFGNIHVVNAVGSQIDGIQARYPDVRITYDHITRNVAFYSWDGQTLLDTQIFVDGSGSISSDTPSRASTVQYDYTFAGWSLSMDSYEADNNIFNNVGGDMVVYAAYTRTVRSYTINFVTAAVDGGQTLQSSQVQYGSTPAYTGSTPTSTNNDGGVYVFDHWTPTIVAVTGTATYTAVFNDISVYVTYMNGDTQYYQERIQSGTNASGPSSNPTKAEDARATYTFSGWSTNSSATQPDANPFANVTANRTLYAIYSETIRSYTITFVKASEDGGGTLETKQVNYGIVPTYTGTTPTTTRTDYVFSGWNPALTAVTGTQTYTAVFADMSSPIIKYLKRNMTAYESGNSATKVAQYAFYNMTTLTTVETYATTIEANAFSNCTNLETLDLKAASGTVSINASGFPSGSKFVSLFIRSSSVATLSGTLPTQFSAGKGAIYVPSGLVDTYKATSPWSTYAGHIFSIDEYPVTNFDTIKDDLSTMCTKLANGTANYDVGDFKTVDLGTEGEIRFQVAAKNVDELSTGGTTAAYTWIAMDILNTTHRMNPSLSGTTEGTGTIGGWGKCEMRTYLNDTIWPKIPSELRAVIKEVKKYSCIYDTSGTKVMDDVTNDKIWIPGHREVWNDTNYETLGPSYTSLFTSNANRIRYRNGTADGWWERSAYNTSYFRRVGGNGGDGSISASYGCGVVLGFCT